MCPDELLRVAHQRANSCWGSVELGNLVLLDDGPEAADVWPIWHSLEDDPGESVQQGSIDHVRVASDPPTVGGGPEHVRLGMGIKRQFCGQIGVAHIASRGVHQAFGGTG